MKLTSSLIAKDSDGEVRVTLHVRADGKWTSARVRDKHETLTDKIHAVLGEHFHVRSIKVK